MVKIEDVLNLIVSNDEYRDKFSKFVLKSPSELRDYLANAEFIDKTTELLMIIDAYSVIKENQLEYKALLNEYSSILRLIKHLNAKGIDDKANELFEAALN